MKVVRAVLVGVGALLVAAPVVATPKDAAVETVEHECSGAAGIIQFQGPTTMWPPNHKYRAATITAIADEETSEVTLESAGTHDELDENGQELEGSGHTDTDVSPDASEPQAGSGSASTLHDVRAERSGAGDGRTYTLDAVATIDGMPCETEPVSFEILVPHDRGRSSSAS